ncbi:MAG TPA: zf-TFIIB domain-containing protein [Candidatus Saccharimonadales bacterium]
MKCPIDQTELNMTDRQGIEIDYCPQCRGVWLDRGELDKIIERSDASPAPTPPPSTRPYTPEPAQYEQQRHYEPSKPDYHHDQHNTHRKHKKEGFLGDLFDF